MPIPERFIEELTARCDIVDVVSRYVRLTKRSGSNQFGLCPFHNEKTPSFSVAPDKQIYHCFGCGKGGGVIGFIMEIENLGFQDAVAFLAESVNMPMPAETEGEDTSLRKRLLELNREAARFYRAAFTDPNGAAAQDYVRRRGISAKTATNFGLGYAPDTWSSLTDAMRAHGYSEEELLAAGLVRRGKNGGVYDFFRGRLMFPVVDVRGSVIGFSGRILGDGEPKYLNTPETPVFAKSRNLFGLNLAKKSKGGYIILVEGNVDVVSLHQAGFDGAVASLGTSLTDEQAQLLSRYTREIVLCYDSDAAGQKAVQRAITILQKLDIKVRVLTVTGAKDPDEFIQKNGPDAFANLIEGSAGQMEYRLAQVAARFAVNTESGRLDYFKEAAAMLAALPNAVEREIYAVTVAETAGVSRKAVTDEVERLRRARVSTAKKRTVREQTRPVANAQPSARSIRYENPRSARAEEGLIRLLYLDGELAHSENLPAPEQFSSPLLGRFYAELLRRIREGGRVTPDLLAGSFTPEEIGHFTALVTAPEDLSNSRRALEDYAHVIIGDRDDEDDLRAIAEKQKRTKSYGG